MNCLPFPQFHLRLGPQRCAHIKIILQAVMSVGRLWSLGSLISSLITTSPKDQVVLMLLHRHWVRHSALPLVLLYDRLSIASRLAGFGLLLLLHHVTKRAATCRQAVRATIALEVVLLTQITPTHPDGDPSEAAAHCSTEQPTLHCVSCQPPLHLVEGAAGRGRDLQNRSSSRILACLHLTEVGV